MHVFNFLILCDTTEMYLNGNICSNGLNWRHKPINLVCNLYPLCFLLKDFKDFSGMLLGYQWNIPIAAEFCLVFFFLSVAYICIGIGTRTNGSSWVNGQEHKWSKDETIIWIFCEYATAIYEIRSAHVINLLTGMEWKGLLLVFQVATDVISSMLPNYDT